MGLPETEYPMMAGRVPPTSTKGVGVCTTINVDRGFGVTVGKSNNIEFGFGVYVAGRVVVAIGCGLDSRGAADTGCNATYAIPTRAMPPKPVRFSTQANVTQMDSFFWRGAGIIACP
jgi:hypothetical protein